MNFKNIIILAAACGSLVACSSAKKERLEQREKMAASSGFYCDFVNGEKYTDVEVVMNLDMGKRCDSGKPFSISQYRSPSDVVGMMYCCSMAKKADVATSSGVLKPANMSAPVAPAVGPAVKPATPPAGSAIPANKPAPSSSPSKDPVLEDAIIE